MKCAKCIGIVGSKLKGKVICVEWKEKGFEFKEIAELCRGELSSAGLRVGEIFLSDGRWYVPWQPTDIGEYEIGVRIICEHID